MSGGQKQRVAIGRAIVREPELFLFDEPLSNLDAELRVQMRVELASLYNRLGTTMIYVTHDQVEAMTMATRMVVLNGGNIEQVGTPYELYNFPRNRFVASFIGSPRMNLVEAAGAAGFGGLALPPGASAIGIRPEQLVLGGESGAGAEGIVMLVEYLGSELFIHLRMAWGDVMRVKAAPSVTPQIGERLRIGFDPRAAHYFDAAGQRLAADDKAAG